MIKGYVVNNTGRSRHIFKRTIFSGQKISLEEVHRVLGSKVPEGLSFTEWLEQYLPSGWELDIKEVETADVSGGRPYRETLIATPVVTSDDPVESGSMDLGSYKETNEGQEKNLVDMQYATPRAIDKMTARDIHNLRLKDNPQRILNHITSVHKLRRALTLCKNDSRKSVLLRVIQSRIRKLSLTL